jgi:hypothetical protein
MATVNNYLSAIGATKIYGNYGQGGALPSGVTVKKRYVNTATFNLTSTQYYILFALPANTIARCYTFVHTAEGATCTADISWIAATDTTASSPSVLINDTDLNSDDSLASGTVMANDVAGYICVMPNHAMDAGIFSVVCEMIPLTTTD